MADDGDFMKRMKYLLIFFNIIFGVGGIAVLAVGLWLSFDKMVATLFAGASAAFFTGMHTEVAVGALIIVVGLVGCCAVIKAKEFNKPGIVCGFLLQMVAGIVVLAVGVWQRFDKTVVPQFADTAAVFFTGVHILVAVGPLISLVGFVGLYGAYKESKPWLGLSFGFMIVIIAMDAAAATWAFSNQSKVVDEGTKIYNKTYNSYNANKNMNDKKILQLIHGVLNCCGTKGPEKKLQDICPKSVTKGCTEVIGEFFKKRMLLIGGLCVGIPVVMICGMVLSSAAGRKMVKERCCGRGQE